MISFDNFTNSSSFAQAIMKANDINGLYKLIYKLIWTWKGYNIAIVDTTISYAVITCLGLLLVRACLGMFCSNGTLHHIQRKYNLLLLNSNITSGL